MAMLKFWDVDKKQWVIIDAPMPVGFSTIQLPGNVLIDADKPGDVLNILSGDHVKVLPNETFDSVVISVQDIGNLANLPTVDKTDLVNALIEMNNKLNNHGYTHNQIAPTSEWVINHNLNRYPSVSVTDSGGSLVVGDVAYIDQNTVKISFSAEFAGTAYLN